MIEKESNDTEGANRTSCPEKGMKVLTAGRHSWPKYSASCARQQWNMLSFLGVVARLVLPKLLGKLSQAVMLDDVAE